MEEREILSLFNVRSERAVEETQKKYGRLIRSITDNILNNKDDSAECENDVYWSAWNSIPPTSPVSLAAYLGKLARNHAISRARFNNRQKRSAETEAIDELADILPGGDLESEVIKNELARAINAFLEDRDSDDRIIFVRRYYYGDSPKEIARDNGFTRSKIDVRLHRIKKELRNYLKEEGLYEQEG